jgi:hypothetical protein
MITLRIAEQFTITPGPRLREEGDFSGQQFREEQLRPMFLDVRSRGGQLLVDLDGTAGYATSFLEETFGGLAREFGSDEVSRLLEFKSEEEPFLIDEVRGYIAKASETTK